MVAKTVTVVNEQGMHMRPAGLIAKAAKEHPECEILLKTGGKEVKAKAVMQIMAAGIKKGSEVEIAVTGEGEEAVLAEFVEMFESGFGE